MSEHPGPKEAAFMGWLHRVLFPESYPSPEAGHGNGPTSRETASIGSDATADRAKVVGETDEPQEPYTQREGR